MAQFRLARGIESLRVQIAQTTARAKALRTGLSPTDAKRRTLDAILGGPQASSPDNSLGLPSQDFSSLWYLDGALQNLSGLVESADAAPTPDEVKAFAMYEAGLKAVVARLRSM